MYKIVRAEELTTNIYLMEVEAERVAKYCQPGQFVSCSSDSRYPRKQTQTHSPEAPRNRESCPLLSERTSSGWTRPQSGTRWSP